MRDVLKVEINVGPSHFVNSDPRSEQKLAGCIQLVIVLHKLDYELSEYPPSFLDSELQRSKLLGRDRNSTEEQAHDWLAAVGRPEFSFLICLGISSFTMLKRTCMAYRLNLSRVVHLLLIPPRYTSNNHDFHRSRVPQQRI